MSGTTTTKQQQNPLVKVSFGAQTLWEEDIKNSEGSAHASRHQPWLAHRQDVKGSVHTTQSQAALRPLLRLTLSFPQASPLLCRKQIVSTVVDEKMPSCGRDSGPPRQCQRFPKMWLFKSIPSLGLKIFFKKNLEHQPFVQVQVHFLKGH